MGRFLVTALVAAGVSLAVTAAVLRRHQERSVPAQDLAGATRVFLDGAVVGSTIPPHIRSRVEDAARRAREVLEHYERDGGPRVAP